MADAIDHEYMSHALRLAANGLYDTAPNPTVGCVLVGGGRVVGTGWTAPAGGPHAERRCAGGGRRAARGATAYVTLEPCCHTGRTGPVHEGVDRGRRRARRLRGARSESARQRRRRQTARCGGHRRRRRRHGALGRAAESRFLHAHAHGVAVRSQQARREPRWPHGARERREPMDHERCRARRRASLARSLERRVDGQRHDRRRRSVARCAPRRSRHRWRDRHQAAAARHRRCASSRRRRARRRCRCRAKCSC